MRFTTPAIVLSLRAARRSIGAVVRLMTPDHGLQAAYVRGRAGAAAAAGADAGQSGRSRHWRRGPRDNWRRRRSNSCTAARRCLASRYPAAAIDWACALSATVLPEGQPYPRLYEALDGLLGAIEAAPAASGWGAALVRYELLLLAELGFGLDLERCAVSGDDDDLVAVSPRSGRAVSARRGRALSRQAPAAAALRARRRACSLARHPRRACAERAFPAARPDHRSRRCPVAAARNA